MTEPETTAQKPSAVLQLAIGLLVFVAASLAALVVAGTLGVPAVVDQACELIAVGWALWLEWYATRLVFGVGKLTAVSLVLLDQSIGIFLASLAIAISP